MLLDPPRKRFQIMFANSSAWLSFKKPAEPIVPSSKIITILPADWHVSMSDAMKVQTRSCVPSKTGSFAVLQICMQKR